MKKSFGQFYLPLVFATGFAFTNVLASTTNGTIDTTFKYSRVCDSADCVTASSTINFKPSGGNITINDVSGTTANFAGYAWGSTLGWINMAPTGVGVTPVTVNIASGQVSGFAWSGVSGYINFNPQVNLPNTSVIINASGEFNGYAWAGGPNGGWIKFACPGSNGDTCVKTDWRPTAGRTVAPTGGGGGGGGGGGAIIPPVTQPTTGTGTTQTGPQNQKNGDYTNSYRADINDSGIIDILDYNSIMVNWNKTNSLNNATAKLDKCKATNAADVNCDGKVDLLDFNIIMIFWGQKVKTS
jgi:hypothetical protein